MFVRECAHSDDLLPNADDNDDGEYENVNQEQYGIAAMNNAIRNYFAY